jgi:hypothetical protein
MVLLRQLLGKIEFAVKASSMDESEKTYFLYSIAHFSKVAESIPKKQLLIREATQL